MKKLISKIKKRLLNRHQRFYHLKNKWWLVHIVVDLILLSWVITLVGADILIYLNQPEATISGYLQTFKPIVKQAQPATTTETIIKSKIAPPQADLIFKALAKYTLPEGDQIGLGPLPPRVGEKTRYWIFFSATAERNDFTELQAKGFLGDNVRLTGRIFANSNYTIKYNESDNSLVWTVNELKSSELMPLIGAVEIEFTPTADQIGQPANLVKQIVMEAINPKTKQKIIKTADNLTTAITEDPAGGIIK